NIAFERRYAENRPERLPELAAELVRLKVDVIAAGGTLAPLAAKRATSAIPIVMAAARDPFGTRLVARLARPRGKRTGLSLMVPGLGGKRLELFKELLPRLSRAAVLWNAANPYSAIVFKEMKMTGRTLGMAVQSLEVRGPEDFDGAFEAARKQRPDAHDRRPPHHFLSRAHSALHGRRPTAVAPWSARICGSRRTHIVRGKYRRLVSARGWLRRQDTQRRQACRSSSSAANDVRAGDKPQDRQGTRPRGAAD